MRYETTRMSFKERGKLRVEIEEEMDFRADFEYDPRRDLEMLENWWLSK